MRFLAEPLSLASAETLFYSVTRRVEFLYLSRVVSYEPLPQTKGPHRPPPPGSTPFRALASRRDSRLLPAAGHRQVL